MSFDLPAPSIVETISFEAILADLMADVAVRFTAAGVTYDVGNLEVDPVKIVLEAAAFREVVIRARGNAITMENLIAFATGSNLDHLAAFYDVTRLTGEDDERLRTRVALTISGRSPAGSVDWYKAAAMRASINARDVSVYRTGTGPEIVVAILSAINGGIADTSLINAVSAVVLSDSVRVVSDSVSVVSAVSQSINVSANIWLLPSASQTVFTNLEAQLRAALSAEGGLGFDLKKSWITAKLHQAGVSRVDLLSPVVDTVAAPNQAIAFGNVTLNYMGRDR